MVGGKKGNGLNNFSTRAHSPAEGQGNKSTAAPAPVKRKSTDPNMTDGRLLVNRRCIYERQLPGDAYVTVHAERLQHGFFNSKNTSDPEIQYVDFLGVNFVMHPGDSGKHRFKAATIKATIQNVPMGDSTENPYPYPQENPRFLMHAPHLIYGAVSPETLQWTFSLAGSLGISDSPVSASLSPSGSKSKSYKLYEMMKIQGSCRTLRSSDGPEFDVEDGEIVWSLSENGLQRSGLPREFTFVMLIQKPSADSRILFRLDIDPVIDAWYGNYPNWWLNRPNYQPLPKRSVNFRNDFGQCFNPVDPDKGFNFASLENSLDDYVNMPGSTSSSNVSPDGVYNDPTGTGSSRPSHSSRPTDGGGDNSQPIYIPEYPQYPPSRPVYYPPFPNAGQIWETSSPFQPGWPRGDPYYGGNGSNNNDENTINIRVLLGSNFTSGSTHRHDSPRLKAQNALETSPASNGALSGRARSLRRTRSSERLNRLSSSPASSADQSTQPTDISKTSNTPNNVSTTSITPKGPPPSRELDPSGMYEINNTPPPDSIRDPYVVNGHKWRTSSEILGYETPPHGVNESTTPPSNGLQRTRAVSVSRRSASQNGNVYKNRYSYPLQSTDY